MKPRHLRSTRKAAVATSAFLTTALVLALPTSSSAQAVSPDKLVGSWVRDDQGKEVRITFQADSTMAFPATSSAGPAKGTAHWQLVGDTLVISNVVVRVGGQQGTAKMDRRVVVLEGKQLTMTRVENTEQGPKSRVYQRADSASAAPSKP